VRHTKAVSRALGHFTCRLEERFMTAPDISADLVDAIAAAKVLCVQHALDSTAALKERVRGGAGMRVARARAHVGCWQSARRLAPSA
jgi:hypothetical protein